MKLLNTMNAIFDSAEHKKQERMSALMGTASAWHGGQDSALYYLVSTERVQTEQHREDCENEIGREINGLRYSSQEDWSKDEIKSLLALKAFVQQFVI